MKGLIGLQKKLVPEILEVMKQRYSLLYSVTILEPVGRRALSESTGLTERQVRGEMEFLQQQGLVNVTSKGMYITTEGRAVLGQLAEFIAEITGLNVLEQQVKDKLNVRNVIILPGNSDKDEWVKQEMAKACVSYLKKIVQESNVIAVTGGTTMAALADVMTPLQKDSHYLFVPARGGMGEKMENQANRIVSEMAKKANGDYRMLYVPDPISDSAYETIINEPAINEILQHVKSANIVIHGIGDAIKMAERRKTTDRIINKLKENKAVSEAFGYYFNHSGEVVHRVKTVGIQLEDLESVKNVITVAGGETKAEAIVSYFKQGKSDLLITDEAAAVQILRGSPL